MCVWGGCKADTGKEVKAGISQVSDAHVYVLRSDWVVWLLPGCKNHISCWAPLPDPSLLRFGGPEVWGIELPPQNLRVRKCQLDQEGRDLWRLILG